IPPGGMREEIACGPARLAHGRVRSPPFGWFTARCLRDLLELRDRERRGTPVSGRARTLTAPRGPLGRGDARGGPRLRAGPGGGQLEAATASVEPVGVRPSNSAIGRTSIEPRFAAGMRAATSTASSRLEAWMR